MGLLLMLGKREVELSTGDGLRSERWDDFDDRNYGIGIIVRGWSLILAVGKLFHD